MLAELGIVPAEHHAEIIRAEYEAFARTSLVQLRRVREGTQLEEDHMRNRQAIVHWLLANTDAISVRVRDGRTYHVLESVERFRQGVGEMLREVQRIKSEGDYAAARALFETYGVHFDPELRNEIVARVDRLHLPSYTGFVMPTLTPAVRRRRRDLRRGDLLLVRLRRADAQLFRRTPAKRLTRLESRRRIREVRRATGRLTLGRWRTRMLWRFSVMLAIVGLPLVTAAGVFAQSNRPRELANVRQLGAALAEYRDRQVQAVAAYYHSQRNHDSAWLLVEFGVSSPGPLIVRRTEVALVTPDGDVVPLATQRQWGADSSRGRLLLQQARTTCHQVRAYFPAIRGVESMRFFGRPEDGETVIDAVQSSPDQVLLGDLMFESPTGAGRAAATSWSCDSKMLSSSCRSTFARTPRPPPPAEPRPVRARAGRHCGIVRGNQTPPTHQGLRQPIVRRPSREIAMRHVLPPSAARAIPALALVLLWQPAAESQPPQQGAAALPGITRSEDELKRAAGGGPRRPVAPARRPGPTAPRWRCV